VNNIECLMTVCSNLRCSQTDRLIKFAVSRDEFDAASFWIGQFASNLSIKLDSNLPCVSSVLGLVLAPAFA
jgi:hypothetical protein